jgi:hypothetical protein
MTCMTPDDGVLYQRSLGGLCSPQRITSCGSYEHVFFIGHANDHVEIRENHVQTSDRNYARRVRRVCQSKVATCPQLLTIARRLKKEVDQKGYLQANVRSVHSNHVKSPITEKHECAYANLRKNRHQPFVPRPPPKLSPTSRSVLSRGTGLFLASAAPPSTLPWNLIPPRLPGGLPHPAEIWLHVRFSRVPSLLAM